MKKIFYLVHFLSLCCAYATQQLTFEEWQQKKNAIQNGDDHTINQDKRLTLDDFFLLESHQKTVSILKKGETIIRFVGYKSYNASDEEKITLQECDTKYRIISSVPVMRSEDFNFDNAAILAPIDANGNLTEGQAYYIDHTLIPMYKNIYLNTLADITINGKTNYRVELKRPHMSTLDVSLYAQFLQNTGPFSFLHIAPFFKKNENNTVEMHVGGRPESSKVVLKNLTISYFTRKQKFLIYTTGSLVLGALGALWWSYRK